MKNMRYKKNSFNNYSNTNFNQTQNIEKNLSQLLDVLNLSIEKVLENGTLPSIIIHLSSFKHIIFSLNVFICRRSIEYFAELKNLDSFALTECPQLTDQDLEPLLQMKNLKKLSLNQLELVSDQYICDLASKLPSLEELSLAKCAQLSDKCIKFVLQKCRSLKRLDISDMPNLTSACLSPVVIERF